MTPKRPPTSDADRALTGRGRAATPRAGVPVVDELAATADDIGGSYDDELTPPPVMVEEIRGQLASRGDLNVEHLEMATLVAERVMQTVMHAHQLQSNRLMQVAQASPGSEQTARRLAELETWRKNEMDPWRLKLTGVDERNGRLGRIDQAIRDQRCDIESELEQLRRDVGTAEEAAATRNLAQAVKAIKARMWAAIAAALVALGGGGYAVKTRDEARDAAVRADARQELRLEVLEQGFLRVSERIDRFFSGRSRAAPSDPEQPTRTP